MILQLIGAREYARLLLKSNLLVCCFLELPQFFGFECVFGLEAHGGVGFGVVGIHHVLELGLVD